MGWSVCQAAAKAGNSNRGKVFLHQPVFAPLKVERDVAPPPPEAETIIIEMIEVISHFARTVSLSVCLSMNQSLATLCVSN